MTKHFFTLLLMLTSISVFSESKNSMGYPIRTKNIDVLPGFKTPPPGYGQVPFWWWTGDDLNVDRMKEQIRGLHEKGISGVQVNYSHYDTPGWLTEEDNPGIFSKDWWEVYSQISEECANLNMGIGMSTYTIDWPQGADNLFYKLFYNKSELNAIEICQGQSHFIKDSELVTIPLTTKSIKTKKSSWANANNSADIKPDLISIWAYPLNGGKLQKGGYNITEFVNNDTLIWQSPKGEWLIKEYLSLRKPGTMNPLLSNSGEIIINGFYQKFEDNAPDKSSKGLNYFFNDELHIGEGQYAWNPDFAEEFEKRKGYNLYEYLPAIWDDLGDITPKIRIDYADVRMSLMEERYFKPIFEWHESRGKIFACDQASRGRQPNEFGDYFRAVRWYTAPGHDTPGGSADLIKGKVSSSIANLYKRPRVWLEGYHSMGWGATPENLMYATRENYLYGCNLLNLHGLYYSTYGSYWEWAPPCYHFRMPYWTHMDTFLGYFDRLSYLFSQGDFVCDVAIIYPVTPYEADMNGDKSSNAAFELGQEFMNAGINFEFIDHESLAKSVVEDGKLVIKDANASYKVLIFPDMDAVRWKSIQKAADFNMKGGNVYVLGNTPQASDRMGLNDVELLNLNKIAFKQENQYSKASDLINSVSKNFIQDVRGINGVVRSMHRKIGFRDLYMVMDASPGQVVEFRTKGAVEIWDPWTGNIKPLKVVGETETGTLVELPLEKYELNIVSFNSQAKHTNPKEFNKNTTNVLDLPIEWNVSFIPTMDNKYGDFRLPVNSENEMIGVEARRFNWYREDKSNNRNKITEINSSNKQKLHGYGTQFYVLGPISKDVDKDLFESKLSIINKVDPTVPVIFEGEEYVWKEYDFSWRYGKEGDQGHQGYHGLKRTITNDFLCLGKEVSGLNEKKYVDEIDNGTYYCWSTLNVDKPTNVDLIYSKKSPEDKSHTSTVLIPKKIFINGQLVNNDEIVLNNKNNPLLIRYDNGGRGHFVVRKKDSSSKQQQPLSMKWYDDDAIIHYDVYSGDVKKEFFSFITAPGTDTIKISAKGKIKAWINNASMKEVSDGVFIAKKNNEHLSEIKVSITPYSQGVTGGALIEDPIKIITGNKGKISLGDWSKMGILNNYSGGVKYSTNLLIDKINDVEILDLGKVAGTAEIIVNGKKAGVKVAPPWKQDITSFLNKGENLIEIIVYNTLSNHYQTIPSNYKGDPISGLLGPVKLERKIEL